MRQEDSKGTCAAVTAYLLWGILPLYWKQLTDVPPLELTAHRVVWTLLLLIPVVIYRRSWKDAIQAFKQPRVVAIQALSALFLVANWLIYVWSVLNNRILEGALGYYITPFLYFLLGFLFWGEKHSKIQIVAIIVAALGVLIQFHAINSFPWVSIGVAATFAGYAALRKTSPLGPMSGLAVETFLIAPFMLVYLILLPHPSFGSNLHTSLWLAGAGLATAAPLLCFVRGARSISLTWLGMLQFIGPTGQFFIGWLVYEEALPMTRMLSFVLIWIAVLLYILSLFRSQKIPPAKTAAQ